MVQKNSKKLKKLKSFKISSEKKIELKKIVSGKKIEVKPDKSPRILLVPENNLAIISEVQS